MYIYLILINFQLYYHEVLFSLCSYHLSETGKLVIDSHYFHH